MTATSHTWSKQALSSDTRLGKILGRLAYCNLAAQGLCHDDQQRRSQGEMGRTEGLCEARYQGLTYAGATRPPIIIYCRTPHTRLSGASSATAAVPLSSTIIIFCHG